MKQQIEKSQATRLGILRQLYHVRIETPETPWVWRRDIEQQSGGPIVFELGYLAERGDLALDGPKYRITAQGIDHLEGHPAA